MQVPMSFMPFCSGAKAPGDPPYDRMILISSRVHDAMKAR